MASGATSDLEDVRGKLAELAAEGRVEELIELVITLLGDAQQSNTALQSRLQNALRALYGRKSEKFSGDQLSLLFAGLGDEAPEAARTIAEAAGDVPQTREGTAGARGKRNRTPFPSDLEREVKNILVPEALCAKKVEASVGIGPDRTACAPCLRDRLDALSVGNRPVDRRARSLTASCNPGFTRGDGEEAYGGRVGGAR